MLAVVSDSRAEDSRWSQDNLPPTGESGICWYADTAGIGRPAFGGRAANRRHAVPPRRRPSCSRPGGPPSTRTGRASSTDASGGTDSARVKPCWSWVMMATLGARARLVVDLPSLVSVFDAEDAWVGTDEDWLERMSAEIPAGHRVVRAVRAPALAGCGDAWDRLASSTIPVRHGHACRGGPPASWPAGSAEHGGDALPSQISWAPVPFGRRFLAESGPVQDNPHGSTTRGSVAPKPTMDCHQFSPDFPCWEVCSPGLSSNGPE